MQRHTSNRSQPCWFFIWWRRFFTFPAWHSLFAQTRLLFQSRGHKVSETHCDSRVVLPLFFLSRDLSQKRESHCICLFLFNKSSLIYRIRVKRSHRQTITIIVVIIIMIQLVECKTSFLNRFTVISLIAVLFFLISWNCFIFQSS